MKKYIFTLVILFVTSLIFISCKTSTEPDTSTGEGEVTVSGQVIDNSTGSPISGAEVNIISDGIEIGKTTNSDGRFAATFSIEKSKQVLVYTTYTGYYSDSTLVSVTAGEESSVTIKLQERTTGDDISGDPASIVLISTSSQSIGVRSSGSVESATITFEVQDSSGNSINIDHSVWVNFKLGQAPGGGEYINPTAIKTNAEGRVTVSLSSGTVAGVVQFVAEINFGGKQIISKPVNISIHGGHPDQTHFSVATEYLNVPGWNIDGFENTISAIVGDKYANPVKPNTSVYFTTTGGVIEGSALTNELGIGTATLITSNPRPVHPLLGKGFAVITATTADENYNKVTGSTIVLFSGYPIITVDPTEFPDIEHRGSTTINYTVMDENGNPIAPGNSINVSIVEGDGAMLVGDVNFTTMDTQSKAATQYTFKIVDNDLVLPLGRRSLTIRIKVSGPNGIATAWTSGIID